MNKTGISWTDFSWNPVSGCSKVSKGCKFCYSETWAKRWHRSFEVTLHPEKLREVEKIPARSKVFVNSMSDLFHTEIPTAFINQVFEAIRKRPDVIFQILTKRPDEIRLRANTIDRILDNVWLGLSVEMKKYLARAEILKRADVRTRFISFAPLLEDLGDLDLSGLDWIVIGGESGPHHRLMNIEWARNIINQAKEQGVAVWMKQLGGLRPRGELEDFPEDLRIREFPGVKVEVIA